MVRIPPMKEIVRRYVKGSLEAFLEGKKSLNWIMGVIGQSGALQHKEMLREIFNDLRGYEKLPRYQEILKECKRQKWLW